MLGYVVLVLGGAGMFQSLPGGSEPGQGFEG